MIMISDIKFINERNREKMTIMSRILSISAAVICITNSGSVNAAQILQDGGDVMNEPAEKIELEWHSDDDKTDFIEEGSYIETPNASPESIPGYISTPVKNYKVVAMSSEINCINYTCENDVTILHDVSNDNVIVYDGDKDNPEIYHLSQIDFK